jgi:hypothetical protein
MMEPDRNIPLPKDVDQYAKQYASVLRGVVIPVLAEEVREAHTPHSDINDQERIALCSRHMAACMLADQLDHRPCPCAGH